jgi:ribosomal protein L1
MASKRYTQLSEKIDTTKNYTVAEASAFIKELKSAKFDETVEIATSISTLSLPLRIVWVLSARSAVSSGRKA